MDRAGFLKLVALGLVPDGSLIGCKTIVRKGRRYR